MYNAPLCREQEANRLMSDFNRTKVDLKSKARFHVLVLTQINESVVYYAPNFKQVEGSYWVEPIRPSVCLLCLFFLVVKPENYFS